MNGAELGANCLVSSLVISQAVVPPTGFPSSPDQSKEAPPHACTSMPRCRLYQAPRAAGSFALKKMPPTPVTRFMSIAPGIELRRIYELVSECASPVRMIFSRGRRIIPSNEPLDGLQTRCRRSNAAQAEHAAQHQKRHH